jgi:proline iminopeptidase
MNKPVGLFLLFLIILLQPGCKQNINPPENLLTAKPHLEDSIIYNIPKTYRLCDEMKVEKLYINIGDCKLYCEIEGEGISMVLIHGGPGGTHHCFHPWLTSAKDRFKIIYYDQRGCGLSDFSPGEGYSFEQTIDDLEKLRKALKIDKWILLGHSFGGGVAQYYTIKYPQNVLGLILVGSVPMMNKPELNATNENPFLNSQEIKRLDKILKLAVAGKLTYEQYFFNNEINGGWKHQNYLKPTIVRQAQLATYDIVFDKTYNSDYEKYNFEYAFNDCPVPTLICEGKYDSLWSSKKVPMMIKNHPNAEFRSFIYSSHNIYRDEPEHFIKVISAWAYSLKIATSKEISEWRNKTNELLGEQLKLIHNKMPIQ